MERRLNPRVLSEVAAQGLWSLVLPPVGGKGKRRAEVGRVALGQAKALTACFFSQSKSKTGC